MEIPLGKVTVVTPGTLVQATVNRPDYTTKGVALHAVMFQAWPGNNGLVYVGLADMDKTTGENVLGIIPVPDTTDKFLPTFSMAITIAPNAFNGARWFIDADQAGDAVLITGLQA